MVDMHHCVTCGHHERDHDEDLGCQRCSVSAQHRFLSSKEADEALTAMSSDLMSPGEFGPIPEHIELQARVFALDMAMKGYDLVSEVMDEPPAIDWVDKAADRYLTFLLKRQFG